MLCLFSISFSAFAFPGWSFKIIKAKCPCGSAPCGIWVWDGNWWRTGEAGAPSVGPAQIKGMGDLQILSLSRVKLYPASSLHPVKIENRSSLNTFLTARALSPIK